MVPCPARASDPPRMRTNCIGLFLFGLAWAGCQGDPVVQAPVPAPEAPVRRDTLTFYAGLLGDWIDTTGHRPYVAHERWRRESDSILVGRGFTMKGKDTVHIEDLKLERTGTEVIYSARIGSQNSGDWVPFVGEYADEDSLVFENPGHDFPQCITYVRSRESGTWEVTVMGMEGGLEREERSVLHFQ